MQLVHTALIAVFGELLDYRLGDFFGRLKLRLVGPAEPVLLHRPLAELEILHGFPTQHVVNDLFTLALQPFGKLACLPQHLRGKRTGETAVCRKHHDRGALRVLSFRQQRVVDIGVGRHGRHRTRHRAAVGACFCHALLGFLDTRGRNQLHRSRNLLGRLGRANLLPVDPKLCTHELVLPSSLSACP